MKKSHLIPALVILAIAVPLIVLGANAGLQYRAIHSAEKSLHWLNEDISRIHGEIKASQDLLKEKETQQHDAFCLLVEIKDDFEKRVSKESRERYESRCVMMGLQKLQ